MVAALALIASMSLFTVALDYPFRGDIHIHPSAYENDPERFRVSELSDLRGQE